jgi:hypothetical protein
MEHGTFREADAPSHNPKIPPFMEPNASLPIWQYPVTEHYPELLEGHIL